MKIQIQMTSESGWFDEMTKSAKVAYIKKHPDSKFAKNQKEKEERGKEPFKIGGTSGRDGAYIHGQKSEADDPSADDHIAYHDHKANTEKDPKSAKAHKNAANLVKKIVKHGDVAAHKKHYPAVKTLEEHHDAVKEHASKKYKHGNKSESHSLSVSAKPELTSEASVTKPALTKREEIAKKIAAIDKREEREIKETLASIKAKYKKLRANVRKGLPERPRLIK